MSKKKIKIKHISNLDSLKKQSSGKILCIILGEGKDCNFIEIPDIYDSFSFKENTYFVVSDGIYIHNSIRILLYLEGISTPLHHGYIERTSEIRSYIDRITNEEKTMKIHTIKGLKFDSKLIDLLLNRHLADEFTKQHMDLPNLAIVILLIVSIAVGIINIAMWYI